MTTVMTQISAESLSALISENLRLKAELDALKAKVQLPAPKKAKATAKVNKTTVKTQAVDLNRIINREPVKDAAKFEATQQLRLWAIANNHPQIAAKAQVALEHGGYINANTFAYAQAEGFVLQG